MTIVISGFKGLNYCVNVRGGGGGEGGEWGGGEGLEWGGGRDTAPCRWSYRHVHSQGHPSKHKTFVEHSYNVGPASKTLGRCCTNAIQMLFVC